MSPQYRQSNQSTKEESTSFHWSLWVAIIGLFVGAILAFQIHKHMMLEWYWLALLIIGFGAVAALAQYKWFMKKSWIYGKKGVGIGGFITYCLIGVAPLLTMLMLILNILIPVGEPFTEEITALDYDRDYVSSTQTLTILKLENNAYDSDPDYRGIPFRATGFFLAGYRTLGFERVRGLFGFQVKTRKYLKFDAEWCKDHERSCDTAEKRRAEHGDIIWMDQWIIH